MISNQSYLKAIAISSPNFSRALSMISSGEASSSFLASCSKSSTSPSFSSTSVTIHQNRKSAKPI